MVWKVYNKKSKKWVNTYNGKKTRSSKWFKGSNKKLSLTQNQANTRAYDSQIEKVMARVARQEDEKSLIKLVFRQYLYGAYSNITNTFAPGRRISFAGEVAPLAQIQLIDQVTMPKVVPAPNPDQTPTTWVDPGVNDIGPAHSFDGFRRAVWISIRGISFSIRAVIQALNTVGSPLYQNAELYYKVIAIQEEGSDITDYKPDVEETGHMVPIFGKSFKLDNALYDDTKNRKVRTFFKGHISLRCDTLNSHEKFINQYIDLSDKPLKIKYVDAEQNGRRIERWKPFIVFQSNIPDGAGYDVYKPVINVVTKVHYTDT